VVLNYFGLNNGHSCSANQQHLPNQASPGKFTKEFTRQIKSGSRRSFHPISKNGERRSLRAITRDKYFAGLCFNTDALLPASPNTKCGV